MGTFEKLGILVIVVIIVMILAVAISQWGGIASQTDGRAVPELAPGASTKPLVVDLSGCGPQLPLSIDPGEGDAVRADMWPGNVPKIHEIKRGDKVWILVVKRWRLKETFVPAILSANPRINFSKLRPGTKLVIPDPGAYRRGVHGSNGRVRGTRLYEVKVGDTLQNIAKTHLGRWSRWREILAINPGLKEKRLKPGQKINVPVK